MATVDGKTKGYNNGLAVHCACGLVFIGLGFRQRYDSHTWKCIDSLNKHPKLADLAKDLK